MTLPTPTPSPGLKQQEKVRSGARILAIALGVIGVILGAIGLSQFLAGWGNLTMADPDWGTPTMSGPGPGAILLVGAGGSASSPHWRPPTWAGCGPARATPPVRPCPWSRTPPPTSPTAVAWARSGARTRRPAPSADSAACRRKRRIASAAPAGRLSAEPGIVHPTSTWGDPSGHPRGLRCPA